MIHDYLSQPIKEILKPCPFCGSNGSLGADIIPTESTWDFEWPVIYYAACQNRDCIAHKIRTYYLTDTEAIEAWNRRVPKT